jgi:hypothetical protein
VLCHRLRQIRQRTTLPVLIAFTYQWQRDTLLEQCLSQNFRYYQVFWWNGPRLTKPIKNAGGTVLWQVGSPQQAEEALECGADILIIQGTEAGGQVRSPYALHELVNSIQTLTGGATPIVAGGGLADAQDVARVLSWGASAALLGTRFLLSEEACASRQSKMRLLRASADALFLDPKIIGDWPCVPRRRLVTARGEDRTDLFAGLGLSCMTKLLPVGEIVRRLQQDTPAANAYPVRQIPTPSPGILTATS